MTAGEFNELAKQGRVWAKIVANFSGKYGLVEKISDDNRDFMFCEFCGTKVRLDDYQETHRFVDEARIQESKDAKELELKKMEFEERKRKEDLKSAFAIIKVSLGITLGGLGILMIGAILETLGVIK